MDKKGVSTVVATVLIILITVAAVALVWFAILPMIQTSLSGGQVCLAASAMEIDPTVTCINLTASTIKVKVGQSVSNLGDFRLVGIKILVTDATGNTVSKTINDTALLPKVNEERVYTLTSADGVTATSASVAIAPIVKSGNVNKECNKGSETVLKNCA